MTVRRSRLVILLLCLLSLALALLVRNQLLSLVGMAVCALAALGVLWHDLPALSDLEEGHPKLHTLRVVTVFNVVLLAICVGIGILAEKELLTLSPAQGRWLLTGLFAVILLVFGNLAPKLPWTRHTGLRLPWTVRDEQTWLVAHRILGWLSLPLGLLCLTAGAAITDFALCTKVLVAILLVWVAVPSVLSLVFFLKKYGKL